MSDIAIRVENLGKRYKLGRARGSAGYRTLREELLQAPGRLWSALKAKAPDDEEFWALRDVSFEVKQGEVLGVIGRNGAGKSTLLKILSRIVEPTAGVVDLYGRVGSLLEVGTGFHPELTGRENIFLSGAMLGMRRTEVRQRLDEIVAFAEVEKFLDTPCKHYSSGMFLRLGFSVAAHLDAQILLVDEVLAVGDVEFQRKCLGKMSQISQGGRTVLLVSHDLSAVRRLASQCAWIEGGRLSGIGTPSEVIQAYLNASIWKEKQSNGKVSFERGQRKIWFAHASLSGPSADKPISMGDTVTLSFEVRASPELENRPICFTVGLRTEEGVPLVFAVDIDSGFRLKNGVGCSTQISIRFERLMLYPGQYFVRIGACSPDGLETFDEREDCLRLFVADAGELSQRRLPRSSGVFFLQPVWTVET